VSRPGQKPAELLLDGPCELSCGGLCDCRHDPADPQRLQKALSSGGSRLTLRGGAAGHSKLDEYLGRARESGYGEIVVRTNGLALAAPGAAAAFTRRGVDGVIVPIFSQLPPVHDRIAGRSGALVQALVALRALAEAGASIEIETPLLASRLQNPTAVVELVHRAVPTVKAIRFYLPRSAVPDTLAPPDWTEGAPALAAAIAKCRELGIQVSLRNADAIPLCALRDFPEMMTAHKFNPKLDGQLQSGCALAAACGGCAAKNQCAGVAEAYVARHGSKGIRPYERRPRELFEQRTTPARKWDEAARQAAKNTRILVLRPTVNCNQDCTFCSANETSNNVWPDSGQMLRVIARAARIGVERVSFSGGDPTLSKDLVKFVRAAKRTGIPQVELVTNGVLLDNPAKVAVLREAGVTHAFVSLHAHDERLSRVLTQKVGDFAKTVKAVHNLVDAGVITVLNHVITARNYRFLKRYIEFVASEWGPGKVMISFAFVTPQYKALENLDLVPRLSDAMPYLQRALHRGLELGVPFIVGSRQGVPPCFLGPFQGWSDVFDLANEAASEDAPQKTQGPACQSCRYRRQCTGLWRPYVAKYGHDELRAVPGAPFSDEEIQQIRGLARPEPWGQARSFDESPALLRDLEAERRGPPELEEPALAGSVIALPTLDQRTRPLRVAMAGSGQQARRIARSMLHLKGLSLDAVASPHAPDMDRTEFGNAPAYRSAAEALDDVRPEALVVAAATSAHHELARLALERGVPVLLEKPLARTEEQGAELVQLAARAGTFLLPAHNDLFAPGLDRLFAAGPFQRVSWTRRCPSTSQEAPRAWARAALFETMHHAVSVVARALGGGVGTVTSSFTRGVVVPELVRVQLEFAGKQAEIVFDWSGSADELVVGAQPVGAVNGEIAWRRAGRSLTLTRGGAATDVEANGSEMDRMLLHFREAVLGRAPPLVTPAEALDVMRTARAIVDAIEAAGTTLERPNAPKHVASRPELQAS
jgi:predicted dehydrogenase/MoaA/NifB/PqqE/SkfB family radical SAM enzyme